MPDEHVIPPVVPWLVGSCVDYNESDGAFGQLGYQPRGNADVVRRDLHREHGIKLSLRTTAATKSTSRPYLTSSSFG